VFVLTTVYTTGYDQVLKFEWDDSKNKSNLQKHGLDFIDAVKIFRGEILSAKSSYAAEVRWIAIGAIKETEIAVIYTMRGEVCRVISARRARKHERQKYHSNLVARSNGNNRANRLG
jgi:uncharacterized protein